MRHSKASGVSGVTVNIPSATGGPFSFCPGPPAFRASRSLACPAMICNEGRPQFDCHQNLDYEIWQVLAKWLAQTYCWLEHPPV